MNTGTIYPVTPSTLDAEYPDQDTFDDVVRSVMSILEEGRPQIDSILTAYCLKKTVSKLRTDTTESLGDIVRGHRKQIARYPAISVDEVDTTDSWLATRVKKEDHMLTVQCKVKIVKMDIIEEYINVFARAVQNWLNAFDNKQYYVNTKTGSSVYDSQAESYTKGYSSDGSLRIAEIRYRATQAITYNNSRL